ncbi:MAG: hypothetical protein O2800_01395 [Planctomycetota bacterium]|nr:hypothetical protein [Planctomycetota bacterium]
MRSFSCCCRTVFLLALALASSANADGPVPEPPVSEGTNPIPGFAIIAVLAVIVIGVSLMPSKRGHQE